MPEGPFLSIIIPTYNSIASLESTLKGVLSQTFRNFEVWVIDGCSSDNTLDIVKEFASNDSRIKSISEKDDGVYDAMNKGIKLAKAEWLYFLGSDDLLYSRTILEEIFSQDISSVDIIYGNVLFKHKQIIYSGESSLERLTKDQISICHQAIFYSSRVFEKVGVYDTRYFVHADYDLNVRCFEDNTLSKKYVNKIIALYNEQGISGTQSNADGYHTALTNYYIEKYSNHKELYYENKKLREELKLIKSSKPYRVGVMLRKILKRFKR
jgi:glycosyltransferase involved in cell wall biosynthesis